MSLAFLQPLIPSLFFLFSVATEDRGFPTGVSSEAGVSSKAGLRSEAGVSSELVTSDNKGKGPGPAKGKGNRWSRQKLADSKSFSASASPLKSRAVPAKPIKHSSKTPKEALHLG